MSMCTFQLTRRIVDGFKPGRVIPHFSLRLRLKDPSQDKYLQQRVRFIGVKEKTYMTISQPHLQGLHIQDVSKKLTLFCTTAELRDADTREVQQLDLPTRPPSKCCSSPVVVSL